jgi:large subunit ribosomal protein L27
MSKTKASKTTKGSRKANPKYLGVKLYGGQPAHTGSIIIRQRGMRFHPGHGTNAGRDGTIYAVASGTVKFLKRNGKQFVAVQ